MYMKEEQDILGTSSKKYGIVIENKTANNFSIEAKIEAWNILCIEYNCQTDVLPRDVEQLKNCWGNAKSRWKKVTRRRSGAFTQQVCNPFLLCRVGFVV